MCFINLEIIIRITFFMRGNNNILFSSMCNEIIGLKMNLTIHRRKWRKTFEKKKKIMFPNS